MNFCSIGVRRGLRAGILAPLAGEGGGHGEGEVDGVQERIGAPGRKKQNSNLHIIFIFCFAGRKMSGAFLLHSAALKALFLLTRTYAVLHTRCVHTLSE